MSPLLNRLRLQLFLAIVVLLASIYMLVYSGRIQSGDSLRFFDAITSSARYGDFNQDETLFFSLPLRIKTISEYPLRPLDIALHETLHIRLATILYGLAELVPELGYVHTVWLFNVIVTAIAGGVLFLFVIALGYEERVAVFIALMFGAATIVVPYSKSFFREPLLMLMLLIASLCFWQWRFAPRRNTFLSVFTAMCGVLALIFAFLTKSSAVFALPALLAIFLPEQKKVVRGWRSIDIWPAAVIAAIGALVFVEPIFNLFIGFFAPALGYFKLETEFIRIALHTYLFSVGGSIWGTSPILLLGLPGIYLLIRQGKQRTIWLSLIMFIGFAFGHAFLGGQHWFGGLSWPPRFLVPTVPFLMLPAIPVVEGFLRGWFNRWWLAPAVLLVACSLWIQWNGVALDWSQYSKLLPAEAEGLGEWGPGLNQIAFLRWIALPQLWGELGFDFVWIRAGAYFWLPTFALLILLCGFLALLPLRRKSARSNFMKVYLLLPLMWLLFAIANLRAIYWSDGLYRGQQTALREILGILREQAKAGDFLVLTDDTYVGFMLNYNDLVTPRVISLPPQPGESPSATQPALVQSNNPADLLTGDTIRSIDHLALKNDRIWLLAHNSAYLPWAVRPVEQYLGAHYYLVREHETATADPTARLLEYSTIHAPDPYEFLSAEHSTDLYFGDAIHLSGFTLPLGALFRPGDVLPVSFYWLSDRVLEEDYVIAWFIVGSGVIVQDMPDEEPYAGFAPTSSWRPNIPVWDNRAMRLPPDLPAGKYEIWTRLYRKGFPDEQLAVKGPQVVDETIGVLPVSIQIEPGH